MSNSHQYIIVKHTPEGAQFLTGFSETGGVWQSTFDNHVFIDHNRDYVRRLVLEYKLGNSIEIRGRKTPEQFVEVERVAIPPAKNAITAVNAKHQKAVNKAYKAYRAYHECVNLDGTFNFDREQAANERKQEKQYDIHTEAYGELPKREQDNFNKQHSKIHGYN